MTMIAFIVNIAFSVAMYLVMLLPSSPSWQEKEAFEIIFAISPVIIFASLFSYFIGELFNSFLVAYLKIYMNGKFFAFRALMSTFES